MIFEPDHHHLQATSPILKKAVERVEHISLNWDVLYSSPQPVKSQLNKQAEAAARAKQQNHHHIKEQ